MESGESGEYSEYSEYSLSAKQENALTLIHFFPEDIVRKILQEKTHRETEDARNSCSHQMSVFNIDNYYYWHAYDTNLSQIIQDMHIINTHGLWKQVIHNLEGLLGVRVIPQGDIKETLQKINLLNREYDIILSLWRQHMIHPYQYVYVQFIAGNWMLYD